MTSLVERIQEDADRVVRNRQDDEAVHDFRVGLRRMRSLLRVSRGIYGARRVKRLEASAKSFGDGTGALRDAEVLEETLRRASLDGQGQQASSRWLADVRSTEAELRAQVGELIAGPSLGALCADAMRLVEHPPKRDQRVPEFADACFSKVRGGVRELLPVAGRDVDRLHRLRIRFKRLRYTCETLAQFVTVFDATHRKKRSAYRRRARKFSSVARDAARMQKELGLLHDADMALISLRDTSMPAETRIAIEPALVELRSGLLDRSLTQLRQLPKRVVGKGAAVVTAEKSRPSPA